MGAPLECLGESYLPHLEDSLILLQHLVEVDGHLHAGCLGPELFVVLPHGGLKLGPLRVERHAGRPDFSLRRLDRDLPHR
jgi:hypothetical protein